jgi:hypothetical protein
MKGAGFAVTKGARRATRIGGSLGAGSKARANRRNRRRAKKELRTRGEDALFMPLLWADWDVI